MIADDGAALVNYHMSVGHVSLLLSNEHKNVTIKPDVSLVYF